MLVRRTWVAVTGYVESRCGDRGAVGACCGGRGQERGDGARVVMLRRSKLLR